jgi:predicted RNA methylase
MTKAKDLDQFFTDPKLAERICDWANLTSGMHVLEPSAGSGSFVEPLLKRVARVTAVEVDRDLSVRLDQRFKVSKRFGLVNCDFMDFDPDYQGRPAAAGDIDLAVMNPPFTGGLDGKHVARALRFAPRVIALLVTNFEHGSRKASLVFERARVTRRVVLVSRPIFHGPSDKGFPARRDHVVLELVRGAAASGCTEVATERW